MKEKANSDSTRRVRLSFYVAMKTLESVETRTVVTNSRSSGQEQQCCNIYFLEPTVRGADVTSTSEVCYDGTKPNSTKKWGLVQPRAVSYEV